LIEKDDFCGHRAAWDLRGRDAADPAVGVLADATDDWGLCTWSKWALVAAACVLGRSSGRSMRLASTNPRNMVKQLVIDMKPDGAVNTPVKRAPSNNKIYIRQDDGRRHSLKAFCVVLAGGLLCLNRTGSGC